MAIDTEVARFLLTCRNNNVNFRETLTLGRLHYFLSAKETRNVLRWGGIHTDPPATSFKPDSARYGEPFLQLLGAEIIESLDASAYEGASIVHDLNYPVPQRLHGRFDVVCDGGTIEHAINFPVVIQNALQMVKIGGHLILCTPGNNLCGHGFFQFSPELWFRVLCPAHGFELRRLLAVEYGPRPRWFEVADPSALKERVGMTNRYPVLMMVLARKTAELPLFQPFPQQSDYVPRWEGQPSSAGNDPGIKSRLRRLLLEKAPFLARYLENLYRCSWLNRKYSMRNPKFFKPVKR
jgi:SAM-dependent methyltransferase